MAPRREDGYSLVALIAGMTVALVLMGAAMPTWKWVVMSDREEELFFRGDSIATAIERFQKKNGNALPTSIDQLVKGKFLRKPYADPMTRSGQWRFVRPGEVVGPGGRPGVPGAGGPRGGAVTGGRRDGETGRGNPSSPTPAPSASPAGGGGFGVGGGGLGGGLGASSGGGAGQVGPIAGVASTNTAESYKLMNGKDKYSDWLFLAGQPRMFGQLILQQQQPQPGLGPDGRPTLGGPPGGGPRPGASAPPGSDRR